MQNLEHTGICKYYTIFYKELGHLGTWVSVDLFSSLTWVISNMVCVCVCYIALLYVSIT